MTRMNMYPQKTRHSSQNYNDVFHELHDYMFHNGNMKKWFRDESVPVSVSESDEVDFLMPKQKKISSRNSANFH
jgi:hypothetical protein